MHWLVSISFDRRPWVFQGGCLPLFDSLQSVQVELLQGFSGLLGYKNPSFSSTVAISQIRTHQTNPSTHHTNPQQYRWMCYSIQHLLSTRWRGIYCGCLRDTSLQQAEEKKHLGVCCIKCVFIGPGASRPL